MNFKKIFPLFLVVLLSYVIVFYQFTLIPLRLSGDEVDFARLALSLDGKPYTPYSPFATGHATLYFYIILLSFKLFGINNFALRLPSALFGLFCPILFYSILKLIFKNKIQDSKFIILNSIIFISLRWFFTFARFGFEPTFLLFLELSSIYFLFKYLDKNKWQLLALCAFFTGLAFNSYTPGRIFFVLIIGFFFLSLRAQAEQGRNDILKALIIFLITILPLTSYLLTHTDTRFYQQNYLQNNQLSIVKKAEFFTNNIVSTALMFNIKGDVNGRHNFPNKPALNPIIGILFVVGLIITFLNWKNFYNQFFLLYFFLSIIPTLLTYPWENPSMLRTFTVIPSVIFFIGNAINYFINLKIKIKKIYLITIVIFLLFVSTYFELKTYYVDEIHVFKDAFEAVGNLQENLGIK